MFILEKYYTNEYKNYIQRLALNDDIKFLQNIKTVKNLENLKEYNEFKENLDSFKDIFQGMKDYSNNSLFTTFNNVVFLFKIISFNDQILNILQLNYNGIYKTMYYSMEKKIYSFIKSLDERNIEEFKIIPKINKLCIAYKDDIKTLNKRLSILLELNLVDFNIYNTSINIGLCNSRYNNIIDDFFYKTNNEYYEILLSKDFNNVLLKKINKLKDLVNNKLSNIGDNLLNQLNFVEKELNENLSKQKKHKI